MYVITAVTSPGYAKCLERHINEWPVAILASTVESLGYGVNHLVFHYHKEEICLFFEMSRPSLRFPVRWVLATKYPERENEHSSPFRAGS